MNFQAAALAMLAREAKELRDGARPLNRHYVNIASPNGAWHDPDDYQTTPKAKRFCAGEKGARIQMQRLRGKKNRAERKAARGLKEAFAS